MSKGVTVYEKFSKQDVSWLVAACGRVGKMLENLAEKATDAGKPADAARFAKEADRIKTQLAVRVTDPPLHASGDDRAALEAGLRVLVTNYRAAVGTVTALGETEMAQGFKDKAKQIEDRLLKEFAEQVEMPV